MRGDCLYRPMTLEEVIEQNKRSDHNEVVYFRATVLGQNRHVYPIPGHQALKIKIQHYWALNKLDLISDTLTIMGNFPCGLQLKPETEYLLVLKLIKGHFVDEQWSGTDLYSKYTEDIALLGPPLSVDKENQEQAQPRTKEKKRSQLVLWLVVSLLLNFFAILMIVLLKRDTKEVRGKKDEGISF